MDSGSVLIARTWLDLYLYFFPGRTVFINQLRLAGFPSSTGSEFSFFPGRTVLLVGGFLDVVF